MALTLVKRGALEYLTAGDIAAPHAFTTRLGGVSEGHLSSLNIGVSRGDKAENVLENYRVLGSALGFSPEKAVLTSQTHSDTVRVVTREDWGAGLLKPKLPPCDALITNEVGTALVIFTADCTPILLYDRASGAVGAAHAGWRGTAADIAGKTVRAMCAQFGCRAQDIAAAVGPNIGQCCFQTDADVPEAMYAALGDEAGDSIRAENGKYYVNLKQINAALLRRAGVMQIALSELCTACRTDLFWSYRRMGGNRGSQGAVIVCKEGSD